MKGNSNSKPLAIEVIGEKVQVRWNIVRNDRINQLEGKTVESWDFDYVNTDPDRDSMIRAILKTKYPLVDDEIAIINNKESKPEVYSDYQSFRELAKQIADETI